MMMHSECLIDHSVDSSQCTTDQSTESLQQEITCLRETLDNLRRDCSSLRCMLITNQERNPFEGLGDSSFVELELRTRQTVVPSDVNSPEFMLIMEERMDHLRKERDSLQKHVKELTEDNNEVYETLRRVTEEKERLRSQFDDLLEELDTCNTVTQFLKVEGNQLKNEIQHQDKTLEEYRQIYSTIRSQSVHDVNSSHKSIVSYNQTSPINYKLLSMH